MTRSADAEPATAEDDEDEDEEADTFERDENGDGMEDKEEDDEVADEQDSDERSANVAMTTTTTTTTESVEEVVRGEMWIQILQLPCVTLIVVFAVSCVVAFTLTIISHGSHVHILT